jgi:hypothetical protein
MIQEKPPPDRREPRNRNAQQSPDNRTQRKREYYDIVNVGHGMD